MNKQGSTLKGWAGHAVDLVRLAKFEIRNPYSYTKARQIRALARRVGAKTLVETGTYLGNTTARVAASFSRVWTIEIDAELHRQASAYLKPRPHVECLLGDASVLLPQVLARPEAVDVLVFLDGHFSGGVTGRGEMDEPACEEIEMMSPFAEKIRGVIVDDFREFGRGEWPRRSELIRAFEDHLPGMDFTVHLDQLVAWRR